MKKREHKNDVSNRPKKQTKTSAGVLIDRNNQYFTSSSLATKLVALVREVVNAPLKNILEPCAGDGSLVRAMQALDPQPNVVSYEIDKSLCKKFGWTHADFLQVSPPATQNRYDAVIANPPFRSGRREQNNAQRGKDLAKLFLLRAFRFAPYVAFIMSQNKGSNGFQRSVFEKCSRSHVLIRMVVVPSTEGIFRFGAAQKKVDVSLFVYGPTEAHSLIRPPRVFNVISSKDYEFVAVTDPSANCLVKRWGTVKAVGRLVTQDPIKIRDLIEKNTGRGGAVNFHLRFNLSPEETRYRLSRMEPYLKEYLTYSLRSVSLTMGQFSTFYSEAQQQK